MILIFKKKTIIIQTNTIQLNYKIFRIEKQVLKGYEISSCCPKILTHLICRMQIVLCFIYNLFQADTNLDAEDPKDLFDNYINTCPQQVSFII